MSSQYPPLQTNWEGQSPELWQEAMEGEAAIKQKRVVKTSIERVKWNEFIFFTRLFVDRCCCRCVCVRKKAGVRVLEEDNWESVRECVRKCVRKCEKVSERGVLLLNSSVKRGKLQRFHVSPNSHAWQLVQLQSQLVLCEPHDRL